MWQAAQVLCWIWVGWIDWFSWLGVPWIAWHAVQESVTLVPCSATQPLECWYEAWHEAQKEREALLAADTGCAATFRVEWQAAQTCGIL